MSNQNKVNISAPADFFSKQVCHSLSQDSFQSEGKLQIQYWRAHFFSGPWKYF